MALVPKEIAEFVYKAQRRNDYSKLPREGVKVITPNGR